MARKPRQTPSKPASSTETAGENEYYDAQAADDACAFFATFLTHFEGDLAGQPFVLTDWQARDIVRPLWGRRRPDGSRQYRTCFIEIPRKNGKSTLAAGLALLLLLADKEPGAQVYCAAADRDQARVVFKIATAMVEANEALFSRVKLYKDSIVVESTASSLQTLSSDAFTKRGINCSGLIYDEIVAAPNRELWDVLRTSMAARRQPLKIALTTAGFDKHSLCWDLHDHATQVRDGIVQDETFLPVIYAADPKDDWRIEETWQKANPGYGISAKPEYFQDEVAQAIASPALEGVFRREHLNQWMEGKVSLIQMDRWDLCADMPSDVELRDVDWFGGLDLASTTDITALVRAGRYGNRVVLKPHFWVPEEGVQQRERRDGVPYRAWIDQGLIETTPGEVIDYEVIRHRLNEISRQCRFRQIGFDPWGAVHIRVELEGDGFEMVQVNQGFPDMAAPTKELLDLILSGRLAHGGHPVLRWMASNVSADQHSSGAIKPSKKKSTQKIDGISATVDSLSRLMANPVTGTNRLIY